MLQHPSLVCLLLRSHRHIRSSSNYILLLETPAPTPAAAPAPEKKATPAPKAESKPDASKDSKKDAEAAMGKAAEKVDAVKEELETVDDEVLQDLYGKEHLNIVFMGHVGMSLLHVWIKICSS